MSWWSEQLRRCTVQTSCCLWLMSVECRTTRTSESRNLSASMLRRTESSLRPEHVREHYAACEALSAPSELIYTNALSGENIDKLVDLLVARLPEGAALYDDPDLYTTQTQREMAAELIREQVLIATREEVPHGVAVVLESWEDADLADEKPVTRICAAIIVERKSQKPILIGRGGSMLKRIGSEARKEIERIIGNQVYLELFVKVRKNWRDRPALLREYGVL
ncbi:MAG: GTPase Era [Armatimonadota bacterium]